MVAMDTELCVLKDPMLRHLSIFVYNHCMRYMSYKSDEISIGIKTVRNIWIETRIYSNSRPILIAIHIYNTNVSPERTVKLKK